MSVERSFEAWEEVQRHGQDLADRLAQGFTGLIQSHMTNTPAFTWPNPQKAKLFDLEFRGQNFNGRDLGVLTDYSGINGVSAIFDIGNRICQAGADFGACLNGLVQQFFRRLPVPFRQEEAVGMDVRMDGKRSNFGVGVEGELELVSERLRDYGFVENDATGGKLGGSSDEEIGGFNLKSVGYLGKSQGVINITSTYDSRTNNIESSLVGRGDLWRVETSHGSSTSGNDNSSLFLVQLGPLLFVRDSTLLLPVHLSKQHLLWYGYDRKNGMHSLCPAVWSKHRRWLLMSMLCLNPLACSFVDLQFPNGQFTYVSGEGLTISAFLPLFGGLLQAQGQYPGEMRFSFSHKNKWGTRITPMVQWPDKSFTLGFEQALAWQRSGLMVRPTFQFSLCPTLGGSNPGLRAELIHSVNEQLNLICGCAFMTHPSIFASLSIGRSKWNGSTGSSGIVVRVDSPLSDVGRPSFSVQINSGIEF
ncbi:hypothetical protein P3X46_006947 [Hevea brasiliensis]|uniref:Bacterial surface antigen (D15) domain-containing protein n=1 Tax=Hevea brasiliensis TaxID=3981 RepID=A0ABQ9MUC8_HEVBR|nr:uncharacterized protein LOC110638957 [Hevea brasiliensis]XP_021645395.2 uncharacterized protein LOC110638957 [Hevea brasiliensis]XP_058001527.1 uncharacterized protein LOC110638957 [Hevea brasiliensis]KAJ9183027.1 hypothetical protein P3X46_006947 [Hevea brasiliensis]KAJ9183028.1 hypothetical protein P3X46_006947 [Hevea brasiliensis]